MDIDYDGPERRKENLQFRIELESRLTSLENGQDRLSGEVGATRQAVFDLRSDIFKMLNPISRMVERHESDIGWLKTWIWRVGMTAPVFGGLAAWALKLLR